MKTILYKASIFGAVWLCFSDGVVQAASRPDYYTSGFYTRGSSAAFYMDQGGVLDPFYLPVKNWAVLPRVTLEVSGNDTVLADGGQGSGTAMYLIPGVLVMYGRPEHNHLYTDLAVSLPLAQRASAGDDGARYMVTIGGVNRRAKTQTYGRIGHRRYEYDNVEVGGRIIQTDYTGDLGVEYRLTTKTSIGVNGSVELHDFGNQSYNDYNRYYLAGRGYYRATPKTDLFVQGGVGMDDLSDEQDGVYSDALFYDLSIGARGKPTPKTSVSGRIGYRLRTFDDDSISDRWGWIASLGAEATPYGFSTFYSELLSDIRPDISRDGDSVHDRRLTLGVNRRLFTERVRGDASVMGGRMDRYRPGDQVEEDYWGVNLGLDWWLRKNLSLGAAYSYAERWNRNGGGNRYENGRWSLRLSWNY